MIKSYTNDIKTLTGTDKVFFSSKRNRNVASLLFNKYGFAQTTKNLVNQKCVSVNCNSCTMNKFYFDQSFWYLIIVRIPYFHISEFGFLVGSDGKKTRFEINGGMSFKMFWIVLILSILLYADLIFTLYHVLNYFKILHKTIMCLYYFFRFWYIHNVRSQNPI